MSQRTNTDIAVAIRIENFKPQEQICFDLTRGITAVCEIDLPPLFLVEAIEVPVLLGQVRRKLQSESDIELSIRSSEADAVLPASGTVTSSGSSCYTTDLESVRYGMAYQCLDRCRDRGKLPTRILRTTTELIGRGRHSPVLDRIHTLRRLVWTQSMMDTSTFENLPARLGMARSRYCHKFVFDPNRAEGVIDSDRRGLMLYSGEPSASQRLWVFPMDFANLLLCSIGISFTDNDNRSGRKLVPKAKSLSFQSHYWLDGWGVSKNRKGTRLWFADRASNATKDLDFVHYATIDVNAGSGIVVFTRTRLEKGLMQGEYSCARILKFLNHPLDSSFAIYLAPSWHVHPDGPNVFTLQSTDKPSQLERRQLEGEYELTQELTGFGWIPLAIRVGLDEHGNLNITYDRGCGTEESPLQRTGKYTYRSKNAAFQFCLAPSGGTRLLWGLLGEYTKSLLSQR